MENDELKKVEDNTPDYLAALQELKQNSVDKSQYEQLREENKRLINAVLNGQTEENKTPQLREPQVIRNELFGKEHSNREFAELSLELRDTLLANGEKDPFLPVGSKVEITPSDYDKAEQFANTLKHCLEESQDDVEFMREWNRCLK